ncbi:hypothetical protein LTR84_000781 [Exophiala bonariae]|uniref:Ubiquitin interaction motif protein n=1 Tax=Exophiala bonariae TaxID=1690606 RepID=A0AAV9NRV2_9EURO|nr:hypothetical protein LTR84_000781 [Exophiala bonariae]
MAGAQPTPDQLSQVCGITQVDESSARVLLRKNNNDPNAAVNAYFEDPVGSLREAPLASQWDNYTDSMPSFNIVADDASMGAAPPMSRPPSRVDNSRPRIDYSNNHAAAMASTGLSLREQEELEDPNIQRAITESMRSTLPAQENGITGAGSHFGPAKRDYYEPNNWALTTFASSREIIDHPPPTKRRRLDDEPAFLRGSKETDYLAPLLTIYHSIPLAREALLARTLKVHTYGHDASWWAGSTDENTKALSMDNDIELDREDCNLLTEVQCLMAFLDATNRAYGSVDALADLQAIRSSHTSGDYYVRFLTAWASAAVRHAPQSSVAEVFVSVAAKDSAELVEPELKPLKCVEAPVNRVPGETLVDLLDLTVWDDEPNNIDDVWFDQVAEVFTVRIFDPAQGKHGPLELSLDPVWYPDRYMIECKDATQEIRKQRQLLLREIAQCTNIQHRCEMLKLPDNRVLMLRDVLDAAAQASVEAVGNRSSTTRLTDDQLEQPDIEGVELELRRIIDRIDQKRQLLEDRKSDLRAKMKEIARQLTRPTADSPNLPHHKYTLQGVSTKPNVTYLRRPNTDLLLEDDEGGSDSSQGQWWRMAWVQDEVQAQQQSQQANAPTMGPLTQAQAVASTKNLGFTAGLSFDNLTKSKAPDLDVPKPYTIQKVTEEEVLLAVKKEHSSVLLVYASEDALTYEGGELSMPLRHFVDRDNRAFAEELHAGNEPDQDILDDRDNEIEFEDVPLIDPNGSSSSARELTPMSTSSPGRDEDGQASPKRLRGENLLNISDQLPSYDESTGKQEMQEKKGNKIGFHAEQMLQKYGDEADAESSDEQYEKAYFMHVENDH